MNTDLDVKPFINETIKALMGCSEQSGILSPQTVQCFNSAVNQSLINHYDTNFVFETLLAIIESASKRDINFNFDRVLKNTKGRDFSGNILGFDFLLNNIKFAAKDCSLSFNEHELSALSMFVFLKEQGYTSQAEDILIILKDGILRKVYLDYYKSQFRRIVSSYLNSNNDVFQGTEKSVPTKRGPRNQNYKDVYRIVCLTIGEYPDVSHYSLSNKLAVHFANHEHSPSKQTLMRWVQDIRSELCQIPQEPYTRRFKLITS
ncbi:hypothetical protein ODT07_000187 [Salmonella enterica]|nr:hypothetical protein [Salmonella enterica]